MKGLASVLALCASLPLLMAGCGGGGSGEAAQTFDDVLRGLRNAAASKKTYEALRYSEDLARQERAVVNAICSVATQLADNNESVYAQEFFERVEQQAEADLGEYGSKPVATVVAKARAVYDFAVMNPQLARHYVDACIF